MNRVCIVPTYRSPDQADGGIRRVVEAQQQHLPAFGWAVTDEPDAADVIACHGTALVERPGVPLVAHCHGLMWHEYGFGPWGDTINKHVAELLLRADDITAPSRWVAHAITRGMLRRPEVVYHGVDADDWAPEQPHLGYVLWNKARADWVSDPRDMNDLAQLLPDVPFLSTFGEAATNVQIIGAASYGLMRPVVQRAGVYLATARETFGIGTLEALAAGVPIAGWRYGGQEEIVIEGETGYLAPWGDYEALADGVRRCLAERDRLSANCQDDARTRWTWQAAAQRYATIYDRALSAARTKQPKVSVVVTCYNLARYLPAALDSVLAQTLRDYELLIVDDHSTDETGTIAAEYTKKYTSCRYVQPDRNLGLAGARNFGWQRAAGKYILFLDADDAIAPDTLATLSRALDMDRSVHIAYGRIDVMNDDGGDRRRNPWPNGPFSWEGQIAHLNQLPYCSLMRRNVLEESGGYRVRDWRAEDASFWSRVTSLGFRAARVTNDATLIYRLRGDSKSKGESGDGDWTSWLPWRLAGDAHAGLTAIETNKRPNAAIVPWGAQGAAPAPLTFWPVRHHQEPLVSVIIPVGPGHDRYLIDALDSVQGQTLAQWECIVVNDGPKPLACPGHPWARVINPLIPLYDDQDTYASLGAGAARNRGLAAARAPLVLFLDADDLLHPRARESMVKAYAESGRYIYSDWATLEDDTRLDGPIVTHTVVEYDPQRMLHGLLHPVTALVETDHARVVGWDEQLPAWEDWKFYIDLAVRGVYGQRLPFPLLIYRTTTGARREAAKQDEQRLYAAIADQYAAYLSGEEPIMACCGGNGQIQAEARSVLADLMPPGLALTSEAPAGDVARVEFIGQQEGAQTYTGRVSGRHYRAGREMAARYHDADVRDVEHLLALRSPDNAPLFRLVPPPPAPEQPVLASAERVERRRGRRA
jgi:glycosyltransferase involved in cell wall biosynthesis